MLELASVKKTVSTAPCYAGGANFKTHVLKKTRHGYAFKCSIGAFLFALLFVLIGVGVFGLGVYKVITTNSITEHIFLIIFGSVFLIAGLFILLLFLKPKVFNKNGNYYYKGFRKNINRKTKNYTPLNRIVALQIIGETIKSDDRSYKSFEINLVLDDASRINVIDHGNLKTIIDNAETLSTFLKIPIWHAESNKE